VEILAYQQTISEEDRKELIGTAGDEGLFLGQKSMPTLEKRTDGIPDEVHVLSDTGIRTRTWDKKEFFFYADIQGDVENAMMLMGYDPHGYCLSFFADRKEPETPSDFEWPKGDSDAKDTIEVK